MAGKPARLSSSPRASAERREMLFALYVALGPDRSLPRVHEACRSAGLQISITTIKSYSQRDHWPARVKTLDQTTQEDVRLMRTAIRESIEAAGRIEMGGRALQQLALRGVQQRGLNGVSTLTGSELARLYDVGARWELRGREQGMQWINQADLTATFLADRLPHRFIALLDYLQLEGEARARAAGYAASQMDALVDEMYQVFGVEPPGPTRTHDAPPPDDDDDDAIEGVAR